MILLSGLIFSVTAIAVLEIVNAQKKAVKLKEILLNKK